MLKKSVKNDEYIIITKTENMKRLNQNILCYNST